MDRLWAILAAPLMAGNDVRPMTDETKAILLNPEVIAINQDSLGRQGARLRAEGGVEVWTRPLAGGSTAVALFNNDGDPVRISFQWSGLGLKKAPAAQSVEARPGRRHGNRPG